MGPPAGAVRGGPALTAPAPSPVASGGRVLANSHVSSAFLRLDIALELPFAFLPGQFAMVNLAGARAWTFSRPFSILAAEGGAVSLLYRIVGRGTAQMGALRPGDALQVLGPLGTPFPSPGPRESAVLVAGGVGLPPVAAWRERWGRPGDVACFGARDGGEVPWDLLGAGWRVSVDRRDGLAPGREAFLGVVTDLVGSLPALPGPGAAVVMACGPLPLLRAAARLAAGRGWRCFASLEEHMGCGYGVCKGCVVQLSDGGAVRNATCCQEGPVFDAARLPILVPAPAPGGEVAR